MSATNSSAINSNLTERQAKSSRSGSKRIWVGRIISGLVVILLLLDGVMKLFRPKAVVDATVQLGYPESTILGIGIVLIICTILYAIPGTSILGAILLTGYLGGAVATHVRASGPLFNVVFAVIFGAVVWLGLVLRNNRLRELLLSQSS